SQSFVDELLYSSALCFDVMDLYAASDNRYGHPLEAGTASMETITALVVGPLCIILAYSIVNGKSYRYPLQIIVCTCQIYGLIWFILQPEFTEGGLYSVASKDPFLFWVLFVGFNSPWAAFPPILLFKAFKHTAQCISRNEKQKLK
ncbi:unnamed protein product, partial [Didymodactylos carnosus]